MRCTRPCTRRTTKISPAMLDGVREMRARDGSLEVQVVTLHIVTSTRRASASSRHCTHARVHADRRASSSVAEEAQPADRREQAPAAALCADSNQTSTLWSSRPIALESGRKLW